MVLRSGHLSNQFCKENQFLKFNFWKVFFQHVFETNLPFWNAGKDLFVQIFEICHWTVSPVCFLNQIHVAQKLTWCMIYFQGGPLFQKNLEFVFYYYVCLFGICTGHVVWLGARLKQKRFCIPLQLKTFHGFCLKFFILCWNEKVFQPVVLLWDFL